MRLFLIMIVVLVVALWRAPSLLDIAPARDVLVERIATHTSLAVEIEGAISLHLVPRIELRVHNVRLAPKDDVSSFSAHIEELRYFVSPLNAWNGAWTPRRIDANGGEVHLRLHPSVAHIDNMLRALSPRDIRISDMRVSLAGLKPDTHIILPELNGRIQQQGRDDYRLTFDTQEFNAAVQFEDISTAQSALTVSLQTQAGEQLTLTGAVQRRPQFQLDAEIELASPQSVATLLQWLNIYPTRQDYRGAKLSGVITLTAEGLRADNLQLAALDTLFQTQLGILWPRGQYHRPFVQLRLAADDIDFTALAAVAPPAASPPAASRLSPSLVQVLGRAFFTNLAGQVRIESNRFNFAGENGRNFIAAADIRTAALQVTRISADLPFDSSFLGQGDLTFADGEPVFKGRFSARSSDTPALMLWLGNLFALDMSALTEAVDAPWLQRTGIVSDISWSQEGLHLSDLTGRLGEERFAIDMRLASLRPVRGALAVRISRLDLQDWGLAIDSRRRQSDAWFRHLGLEPLLVRLMRLRGAPPQMDIHFATDNMLAGVDKIGAVDLRARLDNRQFAITRLHFADYLGAAFTLSGTLAEHERRLYGALQTELTAQNIAPFAARFLPQIPFVDMNLAQSEGRLAGRWTLTAPDDVAWPYITFAGAGTVGDIDVRYQLRTPARDFDLSGVGSKLEIAAEGEANALARRFNLPPQYQPRAAGRLNIAMDVQTEAVSRLTTMLTLDRDRLAFAGLTHPDGRGYRIEGTLTGGGRNLASFWQATHAPLPFMGEAQITLTDETLSFSNLLMDVGTGKLTGEGVLQGAQGSRQFNANMLLTDFDASVFLPSFVPASKLSLGWSDSPMKWGLLATTNANLELRLERLRLSALDVEQIIGSVRLFDGVLEAPRLQVSLLGGAMALSLQAEGGVLPPSFNIAGTYQNIKTHQLFQKLYGHPLIEADLVGSFELKGRGRSAAQMMASLAGDMRLEAGVGKLTFIDLDMPDKPNKKGTTPFTRMLAIIGIKQGLVEAQAADFVFAAPRPDGKFKGQLDMTTRQLAATLDLFSARDALAHTITLTGDAAMPKIAITPSGTPPRAAN